MLLEVFGVSAGAPVKVDDLDARILDALASSPAWPVHWRAALG
jgi:hypothetical protein